MFYLQVLDPFMNFGFKLFDPIKKYEHCSSAVYKLNLNCNNTL